MDLADCAHLRLTGAELDDLARQAAIRCTGGGDCQGRSVPRQEPVRHLGLQVRRLRGLDQGRAPLLAQPDRGHGHRDRERLPDRFGLGPAAQSEWGARVAALRRAVDEALTARQRQIFVAVVLNGVPLDALVAETGSNRNAIYKMLFDARRKLRAALVANGYLETDNFEKKPRLL
jgi:RNA polymerase sigma-70 factor (ECF subfamily)